MEEEDGGLKNSHQDTLAPSGEDDFRPFLANLQNINNGGSREAVIPHTEDLHFFNTDTELVYHNFCGDFGPLNLTCLYKFCKKLTNKLAAYAGDAFYEKFVNSRFGRKEIAEKLREKFVKKKVIVYYTSTNNAKRANAAFLISSFALLYLGFSPRLAYKTLQPNKMRYQPFQDASAGLSPYKINMKDCLDALHKASAFGFFNFHDFNVNECSYYENTEHGDLNWIIPQKFLAFPGPVEEKNDYYHHPNFYIEYFLCNNVTDVVRLSQRAYDAKCFTLFNIKHHDLFMQDGTDPPDEILKSFLNIAETATGAIAVHCKAGLGRTGTLIGAYLLKHYRMTPKEAIAWIRICRPGSVIGHQQAWLESYRDMLWFQGNEWRYKVYGKTEIVPFLPYGIYSVEAPRKEFPGLREFLINLTKRSRYRFMKNRTKSSKAKLQQSVRHILSSGRVVNEKKENNEKISTTPIAEEQKVMTRQSSVHSTVLPPREVESSKNLHYLKPPPTPVDNPCTEYNQEYMKPMSGQAYRKEQTRKEQYNPNAYESKPAMYSNPNSFYTAPESYPGSEYSQNIYAEKYSPQPRQEQPNRSIPKSHSERIPSHQERLRAGLESKSIDKNWKQGSVAGRNYYRTGGESRGMERHYEDNVCAFDARDSQLSRSSRQYSHVEQPKMSSTNFHLSESKPYRKWEYSKSIRSSNGLFLSPEDLQSWMETFDEKTSAEIQGDKKFQ